MIDPSTRPRDEAETNIQWDRWARLCSDHVYSFAKEGDGRQVESFGFVRRLTIDGNRRTGKRASNVFQPFYSVLDLWKVRRSTVTRHHASM